MTIQIRKIYTVVEEIFRDGRRAAARPVRKAAAVAVFQNPFAGQEEENLDLLVQYSEELGRMLVEKAVAALGEPPEKVESYGKGAIVGELGELEHAAALLHPKLGTPMRGGVGGGKALIPSAKKLGGPGTSIDIPLHYKNAAFVRSHFDAMEVRVPDAPRGDEICLIIAVTNGGRPCPRVGGLTVGEVKGEDGLR